VKVWFVIYDLLPVLLPQGFPEGAQAMHQNWLATITQFDGVVAISRAVADELAEWLEAFGSRRERPLSLGWFHLGADVDKSVPTTGLPPDAQQVLTTLTSRPSFLMVSTIEPRKGHAQTLEAFEQLWAERVDVNLVIVGKQGWMVEALVDQLRTHPERGKRLFWLEGISDEYLEKVYAASTCLIAASYGEGFGLPLIEAAQHKLPIIARDIPVFREVAGDHAYYFDDSRDPAVIAQAVRAWLALHRAGTAPSSEGLPWLTWKQSAEHLLEIVLGQAKPWKTWLPEPAGVMR
jgi:glycosyltransferase involved in cell wall biosynthesis